TLYRMIDIDAAPTAAQLAETTKAEQELAALAKSWDALAAGPLAQLNTAFAAAGLTAIRPAATPETQQEHGEEEQQRDPAVRSADSIAPCGKNEARHSRFTTYRDGFRGRFSRSPSCRNSRHEARMPMPDVDRSHRDHGTQGR